MADNVAKGTQKLIRRVKNAGEVVIDECGDALSRDVIEEVTSIYTWNMRLQQFHQIYRVRK